MITYDKNTWFPSSWPQCINDYFSHPNMCSLRSFLKYERSQFIILPAQKDVFKAFFLTPFKNVKIVILGQDPYIHTEQAMGLAFSVPDNVTIPPSLNNIYKEIYRTYNTKPISGNLTAWAKQGVFLLNSILTVREGQALSHQKKGWEAFTDLVIQKLNQYRVHLVFMLWGNYAQKKRILIDHTKHLILDTSHPSPLSAHLGFIGCDHFQKANKYFLAHNIKPIDWVQCS